MWKNDMIVLNYVIRPIDIHLNSKAFDPSSPSSVPTPSTFFFNSNVRWCISLAASYFLWLRSRSAFHGNRHPYIIEIGGSYWQSQVTHGAKKVQTAKRVEQACDNCLLVWMDSRYWCRLGQSLHGYSGICLGKFMCFRKFWNHMQISFLTYFRLLWWCI